MSRPALSRPRKVRKCSVVCARVWPPGSFFQGDLGSARAGRRRSRCPDIHCQPFAPFTGGAPAGFHRVLALQNVPQIDANADSSTAVTALSGLVYAATLDPDGLLINEDPNFLSKHQFEGILDDDGPALFNALGLTKSNTEPGSYLSGGFINVDELARELPSGGKIDAPRKRSPKGRTHAASVRHFPPYPSRLLPAVVSRKCATR